MRFIKVFECSSVYKCMGFQWFNNALVPLSSSSLVVCTFIKMALLCNVTVLLESIDLTWKIKNQFQGVVPLQYQNEPFTTNTHPRHCLLILVAKLRMGLNALTIYIFCECTVGRFNWIN